MGVFPFFLGGGGQIASGGIFFSFCVCVCVLGGKEGRGVVGLLACASGGGGGGGDSAPHRD